MAEYDDRVVMLRVSPCEHGNDLTLIECTEGSAFADPNCRLADGKTFRGHLATRDKYAQSEAQIADIERLRVARERAKMMREQARKAER